MESKTMKRNVYYFDPKIVDLDKLREEAKWYSMSGGGWSKEGPIPTTIHYHDASEPCTMYKHEEVVSDE